MTIASFALRAAIHVVNAAGCAFGCAGVRPVVLEERSVLEEAQHETGLADFGGEEFRPGLRLLMRDLEGEAGLTLAGRFAARHDTVSLLTQRLRLAEDRRRHPAIAEQEIRRPLFIVGLPRTGSTLLHHLLGQDPASRAAQAWEVMAPSPPPKRATYATDPRIARAARDLAWLDRLAPAFKAIHPLGPRLPLECMAITSYAFLSQRFPTMYRVRGYQAWLERQPLRPAYEFHRRFLQHLQWRAPGAWWVLKAPSHAHGLDALLATYPDARVVQTHRDPVSVLASTASLTAALRGAFSDDIDLAEIGRDATRHWAIGLERMMRLRRARGFARAQFFDVHYHELVRDPLGVIARLYVHFDIPLSAAARERMRRHLGDYPKDRHGPHAYSLATFGLDPQALRARFRSYYEHYSVPVEADSRGDGGPQPLRPRPERVPV